MKQFFEIIPRPLFDFFVVTVFSLIIGVMQKRIHHSKDENMLLGTDRTFTFIGILSYILLLADIDRKFLFIFGGIVLIILLAIFYLHRIKVQNDFGLTTILVALLTYCLPLLIITQPFWLYLLVFVTIIIFAELKETFKGLSEKFNKEEVITLGKFLIIAGVILPIVPDVPITDFISISPYKIWLAVVVISSISYISYLLQKFVLKDSGYIVAGILGGLYSSTATTVVLARKTKHIQGNYNKLGAGIVMATMMMYLRVLVLVFIFNPELGWYMFPYLIVMMGISGIAGFIVGFLFKTEENGSSITSVTKSHPLELRVALIFTVLFVALAFIIHFVMQQYGNQGLSVLSYLVGFADIDPFLLNLFQGHYSVPISLITAFSFHAIIGNNIIKLVYSVALSEKKARRWPIIGFSIIIISNSILLIFIK